MYFKTISTISSSLPLPINLSHSLKRTMQIMTLLLVATLSKAQAPLEGTTYYLPKTAMHFTFLIEKTSYQPGQFAAYARRYLKKNDVEQSPTTSYRIIDTRMDITGEPDSAKCFQLLLDKRFTISELYRADNGILLAINAQNSLPQLPGKFVPAPKPKRLNPKDFMNEDILTAGSTAKMAELVAGEIYEIRESRSLLQRGQAEFMPTDGEQLRIMMEGLRTQETALLQLFEGYTEHDTTEVTVTYVPMPNDGKQILFRFSQHFGMVDTDDLSGAPYYVEITSGNTEPVRANTNAEKRAKDDINLYVNVPQKISVTLSNGNKVEKTYEIYAGQFGRLENLSGELFGKKQTTRIVLNPITGGIERMEEQTLKN